MTLVLVAGGIDLSAGSVLASSGALVAVALTQWQWPVPVAVVACLALGAMAGVVNGLIVVRWAIPSFIVTLGMLEVARGGAYLLTDSRSIFVGGSLDAIGASMPGLEFSRAFVVALVLVGAGQVLLTRTVFGRYLVAIGTNREAGRQMLQEAFGNSPIQGPIAPGLQK